MALARAAWEESVLVSRIDYHDTGGKGKKVEIALKVKMRNESTNESTKEWTSSMPRDECK